MTEATSNRSLLFGAVGLASGMLLGLVLGAIVLPTLANGIRVTESTLVERTAESTPIERAAKVCNIGGRALFAMTDGQSIEFENTEARFAEDNARDIRCILDELAAPVSVVSEVMSSPGGSAEWGGFTVAWEQHPATGIGATIGIN